MKTIEIKGDFSDLYTEEVSKKMTLFFLKKDVFSAYLMVYILMVYILRPIRLRVFHRPLQKVYNSMSVRTAVVY